MRAVIQRVTNASVTINGQIKSQIGAGYLILLGVCNEDTSEDVEWLVKKIANLSSHCMPATKRETAQVGSRQAATSTLSHSTKPSANSYQKRSENPLGQVNSGQT